MEKKEFASSSPNLDHMQFLKSRNPSKASKIEIPESDLEDDIIDLSRLNFSNDETWLYTSTKGCNTITNLHDWLHADIDTSLDEDNGKSDRHDESPKNIDTRTFTRPKKRFIRPSIEKYNQEMYNLKNDSVELTPTKSNVNDCLGTQDLNQSTSSQPLNFDLTQPANSYYFENILGNCAEADSFQNMSPPSLVSSMCSSTFANLMESSFIKNDPVLREIRDADYTENVLLQDSEPPMFQSITESCSSLNSDTTESFLKRISLTGSFKRNVSREVEKTYNMESVTNCTLVIEADEPYSENDSNIAPNISNYKDLTNPSGTFRRPSRRHDGTFNKYDLKNNSITDLSAEQHIVDNSLNQTQTLIKDCSIRSLEGTKMSNNINYDDSIGKIKNELSEGVLIKDLNRLSYCMEDENARLDSGYTEINHDDINRTINKRSSIGCSTGSADSLDRMSSISNSSRESNRILNMADVDAIVEKQERSLNQVMSTPKPNLGPKRFFENNFISPIIPMEPLSDSELSSNDEYRSVRSTASKNSLENFSGKTKSMGYLAGPIDTKIKNNPRSTFTLANQKPVKSVSQNLRNSHGNLQKNLQTGSYQNLYRPSSVKLPNTTASSNLKTMGPKLKGSYTSLRPASAHLPVAPPPVASHLGTSNAHTDVNLTHNLETQINIVEVPPMPRENTAIIGDNTFVKPLPSKASGLPRPTGIPRPASRIPAPRSSVLRPASSRSSLLKKESNYQ